MSYRCRSPARCRRRLLQQRVALLRRVADRTEGRLVLEARVARLVVRSRVDRLNQASLRVEQSWSGGSIIQYARRDVNKVGIVRRIRVRSPQGDQFAT
jgi:hypothetical protein